jgi:hypothetical protein
MSVCRSIDKLIVVESYPGCWSVDAEGVKVVADTAAEAVTIVHTALLGPKGGAE